MTTNVVLDDLASIDHITLGIYFKGRISKSEFMCKLVAGEIASNDCYEVDGITYIGEHPIEYDRITDGSEYETSYRKDAKLRSYTCYHCGGSIDTYTMQCIYCGVKYFFS